VETDGNSLRSFPPFHSALNTLTPQSLAAVLFQTTGLLVLLGFSPISVLYAANASLKGILFSIASLLLPLLLVCFSHKLAYYLNPKTTQPSNPINSRHLTQVLISVASLFCLIYNLTASFLDHESYLQSVDYLQIVYKNLPFLLLVIFSSPFSVLLTYFHDDRV
jgi:hypothetical protein